MQQKLLALAVLVAIAHPAVADDVMDLGKMVVTAPEMTDPLTVVTDPKNPVQPVPAQDGAAYLKNIPGFDMIRKGGTSGDPVFRGEAASRLNILADDQHIFGGCGMRMDPPTAYTYPEAFDRITVLKGPQSVRYGVSPAGTVLFEREPVRFTEPTLTGEASLLAGSFGRHDEVVDATAGNTTGALRGIFTRSESGNYEDGSGHEVHSRYQRWSGTASGTWNATSDTQVELTADRSDAQAAYADRSMDGVKFDRTGYGGKITSKNVSPLFEKVEVSAFQNYVDHVMDNFSLRTTNFTMMNPAQYNNPDRTTTGARVAAQLGLGDKSFAWIGVDEQGDKHTLRKATGAAALAGPSGTRNSDAEFSHTGAFTELEHELGERDRVVAGLRVDWEKAEAQAAAGFGGAAAGTQDKDTNSSGFGRWEHSLDGSNTKLLAGYGVAVRSPDYWERAKLFTLSQERNSELDLGVASRADKLRWTASGFYSHYDDYILVTKTGAMSYAARNIEAITWGGEADATYNYTPAWSSTATFAYVWGDNKTDNKPLAQMPPAQATLSLDYAEPVWSAGVLVRVADEQTRVDVGSGNVVGQDIGKTPGFTVWSINGGYKPAKNVKVTAGVDNLFNTTYAEHISRSGAAIVGFETTTRVNEPGRNYWMKASVAF